MVDSAETGLATGSVGVSTPSEGDGSSRESPLNRLVRFGGPSLVSLPRRGYLVVVLCPKVDAPLDCLQST